MEKRKISGRWVAVYTQAEMLQLFEKKQPVDPPSAHPGFLQGVERWDWSLSYIPEDIDQWVCVNSKRTKKTIANWHFRSLDSEHHVSVENGELIYWRASEQEDAEAPGSKKAG